MSRSRYREARTLVRRLCRLPGEDRAEFRRKIARLREHFNQFNVDVADLCQWLMGIRPKGTDADRGLVEFWGFFLEPSVDGVEADEAERDRWRLAVFDAVAGIRPNVRLGDRPLPESLCEAIKFVAQLPKKKNATRLFERMPGLDPAHRLVLLKAAAEWIVARYQRGIENWERQHEEWVKEKQDWEAHHPALTEDVRSRLTTIFKELVWDPDKPPGVRNKRPRICGHDRLSQNKDTCIYAGEKGHGPLCWKYVEFLGSLKAAGAKSQALFFAKNAERYVRSRAQGMRKEDALASLYQEVPRCEHWFAGSWSAYLKALAVNEDTVVARGRLPHCLKIGDKIWEKSNCEWNPHTELCRQYKEKLDALDPDIVRHEQEYREWRRDYLAGPQKPSFRYPSSRDLPMPKIFGERFYEVDFDRSVLRLRLDDMREGEWMEYGFIPWPRKYCPRPADAHVTSVHVNFVGSRARVGFRFDVCHRESRFGCTQDEIDELRSRTFPRQAQDQAFLDEARTRLLESFSGDAEQDLRILAVDLGETGAQAAVYHGRTHQQDVPLAIIKIDACYDEVPDILKKDESVADAPKFVAKADKRGLRKEHVGRHLEDHSKHAAEIAGHRQDKKWAKVNLRSHDLRGLTRHVQWMIRDWVRHNTAQIVAAAEAHQCDLIVFESQRGFKPPGYDKLDLESERKKRWLAMFAFGRIRRKVVEKAVERGMRVVTVPYFKSSQTCSGCGHQQQNRSRWERNKKQNRRFECECGCPQSSKRGQEKGGTGGSEANQVPKPACKCTLELNSDANAARVLARVFWDEIRLPAPPP
jgi:hypothetical protein